MNSEKVHKAIDTAISRIDEAVGKILDARQQLDAMKRRYSPRQSEWQELESLDDKLHDALAALGQ